MLPEQTSCCCCSLFLLFSEEPLKKTHTGLRQGGSVNGTSHDEELSGGRRRAAETLEGLRFQKANVRLCQTVWGSAGTWTESVWTRLWRKQLQDVTVAHWLTVDGLTDDHDDPQVSPQPVGVKMRAEIRAADLCSEQKNESGASNNWAPSVWEHKVVRTLFSSGWSCSFVGSSCVCWVFTLLCVQHTKACHMLDCSGPALGMGPWGVLGPQFQSKKSSALHDHIDSSAELQQDHDGFMSLISASSVRSQRSCLFRKDNKGDFHQWIHMFTRQQQLFLISLTFLRGFRDSSTNWRHFEGQIFTWTTCRVSQVSWV